MKKENLDINLSIFFVSNVLLTFLNFLLTSFTQVESWRVLNFIHS
jgi:hypothetical protein